MQLAGGYSLYFGVLLSIPLRLCWTPGFLVSTPALVLIAGFWYLGSGQQTRLAQFCRCGPRHILKTTLPQSVNDDLRQRRAI